MSDFMERLNQYGPWLLLFFGSVVLINYTVLLHFYARLYRRFVDSAMYRRLIEKENTPAVYRTVSEWTSRNVDAPFIRWMGVIQGVAMIAGGVAWLSYR